MDRTPAQSPSDDLSALAWVCEEVRKSLDTAHKALWRCLKEAVSTGFSDVDAIDPALLRSARQQIHQGVGALELAGLPAGAMLLRAAEGLVQRYVARPQSIHEEGVKAIEAASFALLDLMRRRLAGKQVSAMALFPQYEALVSLSGPELARPADLWVQEWPPVSLELPMSPPRGAQARPVDAAALSAFETALLRLLRSGQADDAQPLVQLCGDLAADASHRQAHRESATWVLACGFLQGVAERRLPQTVHVKRALSALLSQLRTLSRGNGLPSDRLAHELLFFCAQAGSGAAQGAPTDGESMLDRLRAAFRLDAHEPIDLVHSPLGRYDPAWVAQAGKRVAAAKEGWSAVAGGELLRLGGLNEQFALVADSLQRLYPDGESLARALTDTVAATVQSGQAPAAPLAMEVATSLLYLEASLDEGEFEQPQERERVQRLAQRMQSVREGRESEPLEPWMETLYRRVSDRQTIGSVVQELRSTLGECEKHIDQFFRDHEQASALVDVPSHLQSMKGVLAVLGLDAAAHAVGRMRHDVDSLLQPGTDFNQAAQTGVHDRLASNLGALGFLVDMLTVQPSLTKSLFVFNEDTGVLSPIMGRTQTSAAEINPVALMARPAEQVERVRTQEVAETLAESVELGELPLASLGEELEHLAQTPLVLEQPELAARVAEAQAALERAATPGDEPAQAQAREEVVAALHDFAQSVSEPMPLDVPETEPLLPAAPVELLQPTPAAPASPTGFEDDDEMRGIFIEEAQEVLAEARQALTDLHAQPADVGLLTTLRRAFHTLKGSSRMVGLSDFGESAWACEQLYNTWLATQEPATEALQGFTGQALGHLGEWVDDIVAHRDQGRSPAALVAAADALRLHGQWLPQALAPQTPDAPGHPDALAPTQPADFDPLYTPELPDAASLEVIELDLGAEPQQAWPVATEGAAPSAAERSADEPTAERSTYEPLTNERPTDDSPLDELPADSRIHELLNLPTLAQEGPEASTQARADTPLPSLDHIALDLSEPGMPGGTAPGAQTVPDDAPWPTVDFSDTHPSGFTDTQPSGFFDTQSPDFTDTRPSEDGAETDSAPEAGTERDLLIGEPAQAAHPAPSDLDLAAVDLPAQGTEDAAPEPQATPSQSEQVDEAGVASDHGDEAPHTEAQGFEAHDDAVDEVAAGVGTADGGTAHDGAAASMAAGVAAEGQGADAGLADHGLAGTPSADTPATPPVEGVAQDFDAELGDEQTKVIGPLRISIPLFNIYLNEADEQSRRLSVLLSEWALEWHRPVGEEAVALAHSLAGNSGAVGYTDLARLARLLEHALMKSQALGQGDPDTATLFNEAADEIRRLLHQFAAGFLKSPQPELLARLDDFERDAAQRLDARILEQEAAGRGHLRLVRGPEPEPDALLALPEAPADVTTDVPEADPTEAAWVAEPAQGEASSGIEAGIDADTDAETDAETDADTETDIESDATLPVPLGLPELRPFESLAEVPREALSLQAADNIDLGEDADIEAVDAIDADLFPIFEEEAQELLPQLSADMRQWAVQPERRDLATACMRTLHTFKGGARLAGAMRLGELAHRMESAVERLDAQEQIGLADIEPLQARADVLLEVFEALQRRDLNAQTAALQEAAAQAHRPDVADTPTEAAPGVPEAPDDAGLHQPDPLADAAATSPQAAGLPLTATAEAAHLAAGLGDADGALADATLADAQAASAGAAALLLAPINWAQARSDFRPGTPLLAGDATAGAGIAAVRVRPRLLDRLVNHAGEVSITRTRLAAQMQQMRGSVGDLTDNLERLRQQLRDIELQAETQLSTRMEAARAAQQEFDPLEFDRYTRFQELTRMMAESVNDVATVQRGLLRNLESAEDQLAAQSRLTRDLQDDLLRTRMVEFEGLSDRLYRVVRQAAKETGKQVRLDIAGGQTEVDRGVLDRMTGAFEHLLRNSVSHGIETPDQRQALGKDPMGAILVSVRQEGNEVSIEFRDDGAGLDLGRIQAKALAQGLIDAQASPTDAELSQLIFTPGFSTAESVTELAGRGIGMDVVRADVNAMGGRIETATAPGQGTSFKLVLPLTTAVTKVVMVRCGDLVASIPTNLVELVRRARGAEVEEAYASGTLPFADLVLPFFWFGALLQHSPRGSTEGRTLPVVIVRSAQQRVALHVDEVLGNQDVVVKNLGPQLSRVPGLAGMTLLASGAVSLIYNPVALATVYGAEALAWSRRAPEGGTQQASLAMPEVPSAPLVLVVDDSLTVRRVTQRLLTREGYRVTLAKDGLEALEKMAEETPVVVLSDIEMPRMDGFDLVRNLRGDARWRDIPIVMITSRIAQKHRDYAAELGVNHYLGKPYSEEELLSLVALYTQQIPQLENAGA